jgi:hypothetical protein
MIPALMYSTTSGITITTLFKQNRPIRTIDANKGDSGEYLKISDTSTFMKTKHNAIISSPVTAILIYLKHFFIPVFFSTCL